MSDNQSPNDHDILIELRSDMKALRLEVQDIRDNTKETLRDHEIRIRFIEHYAWIAIGAVGLVQIYFLYKQAFPAH
jgi:hypothetical protein